jgi:hypothetical protein
MKEKLTREVLEAIVNCVDRKCTSCPAKGVCVSGVDMVHIALATALLEERAKPKVWDGAPEWATNGRVYWTNGFDKEMYSKLYTRELPKTRARQIAENIVHGINGESRPSTAVDIEYVEGILNKYAEELKGEA